MRVTAVGLFVLVGLSACSRIDYENSTILKVAGIDVPMCPDGGIVVGSVPLLPSEPSGAAPRNAFNPFADDHKLPPGVVELDGANEGTHVFALSSADGRTTKRSMWSAMESSLTGSDVGPEQQRFSNSPLPPIYMGLMV